LRTRIQLSAKKRQKFNRSVRPGISISSGKDPGFAPSGSSAGDTPGPEDPMKRAAWILVASVLIGCGGGGGGGDAVVTPPSESLRGRYSLSGFHIVYSDGTVVDDTDLAVPWSGSMTIANGTISQTYMINGTTLSPSGTMTVSWIDNNSGTFHITDTSGTTDADFTISGLDLTTYSGVVDSGIAGVTFEEWDYWTKTSDSFAPETQEQVRRQEAPLAHPGSRWIGGIVLDRGGHAR
jgi:hypothetical protein